MGGEEKKKSGRKASGGIAKSAAQRKREQRIRQAQAVDKDEEFLTEAECLALLSSRFRNGPIGLGALRQLAKIHNFLSDDGRLKFGHEL